MSFGVSIYPSKKGHFVGIGVWEREGFQRERERERVWDWEGEGLTLRLFLFHFDLSLIPDHPTTSASHQHHVSLSLFSIYFPLHFFTHISRVSFSPLFLFQIWTCIVPPMASKRILKELKDLQKDPPTSCSAGISFSSSFHTPTTIYLSPLTVL